VTNPPKELERRTIVVGDRERTYWLAPRPNANANANRRPAPLLVVLHGLGTPVATMAEWSGLATRGPEAGFATVFAEGIEEMWDDTGRGRTDGVDDDAFARALVGRLTEDGIADPNQLFLVGLSNGGFFSERLARTRVLEPRGIVLVVSTTRAATRQDTPVPEAPTAVLCFAGTADRLVPYTGGRSTGPLGWFARRRVRPLLLDPSGREVVGAEALAEDWASANGLPATPHTEELPGTELPIRRLSWTAPEHSAADHPPVVLYRIEGGSHGWPGGPQVLPARLTGRIPSDLDATGILLDFAREILATSDEKQD
jgi:polyhydroxybutyrate depolymerase